MLENEGVALRSDSLVGNLPLAEHRQELSPGGEPAPADLWGGGGLADPAGVVGNRRHVLARGDAQQQLDRRFRGPVGLASHRSYGAESTVSRLSKSSRTRCSPGTLQLRRA